MKAASRIVERDKSGGGITVESLGARLAAVAVVNLFIWLAQKLAHRWIPALNRQSDMGIMLVLMPLGFGVCGFDLPYWGIAPFIIAGVVELLNSFRVILSKTGHAEAA